MTVSHDGLDLKTIVSDRWRIPEGIVVDAAAGQIYWTDTANLPTVRLARCNLQQTDR